jgi:hypothetical protein
LPFAATFRVATAWPKSVEAGKAHGGEANASDSALGHGS